MYVPKGYLLQTNLTALQKVKEFLYNNGGCREGEKEMISYIRHLIGYMVAVHENKGILDQKMKQQHPGLKNHWTRSTWDFRK